MKVLYKQEDLTVIAEVFEGDKYFKPDNVEVYEGTLDNFYLENPEYIKVEEYIEEPIEEDFTDYEEIN